MGEGGEEEEAGVVICTMYIPYGLYALPLMLRGCTALKARAFLVDESGFTAETWGCWVE
jgi:hypothetical protein